MVLIFSSYISAPEGVGKFTFNAESTFPYFEYILWLYINYAAILCSYFHLRHLFKLLNGSFFLHNFYQHIHETIEVVSAKRECYLPVISVSTFINKLFCHGLQNANSSLYFHFLALQLLNALSHFDRIVNPFIVHLKHHPALH